MQRWIYYLHGYVELSLTGLSPERFFNLCGSAGFQIWNIVSEPSGIVCCMDLASFFHCRPYVRKAGVRLRIRKKAGLPFWLKKNRSRWLWAFGVLSSCFLLFVLSFFIWDIEYQGNITYTDSQLQHSLERLGVFCGVKKASVSCDALEAALREEYGGITWISVRVSGTRLYVQVKENEVWQNNQNSQLAPCDLIADADAVIQSIIVRRGIPMVRKGDRVEKGDLLVSGRIPITDDSGAEVTAHYVHSDAEVIGRRTRKADKTISCWHQEEAETGRKRYGIALACGPVRFVWIFPNIRNTPWRTVTNYQQAELFGDFALPLYLGLISSEEISVREDFYTEEELFSLAEAYQKKVTENLMEKGVHIIENNVKILVDGSVCHFQVMLETEEPIQLMSQQGEEQSNEHN